MSIIQSARQQLFFCLGVVPGRVPAKANELYLPGFVIRVVLLLRLRMPTKANELYLPATKAYSGQGGRLLFPEEMQHEDTRSQLTISRGPLGMPLRKSLRNKLLTNENNI